jgi:hypothetical protein
MKDFLIVDFYYWGNLYLYLLIFRSPFFFLQAHLLQGRSAYFHF